MTAFKRNGKWAAKFFLDGKQHWVKGGPWHLKSHAQEAERRLRDRLKARLTDETCASFVERWLDEWPRPEASTRKLYGAAAQRFAESFGPTLLGDVERMSARSWALTVPRRTSQVIGTMYEDARNVGLVETNPFANLRLPVLEKRAEIVAPTMDEYRRLLAGCSTLEDRYAREFKAMIQFSAWTGIRQGELFGLQWPDVSEDEILVARARKLDGTLGLPKNGLVASMPFPPPARVLDDVERWEGSPFVFHSPQGRPLIKGTHAWTWNKVRAAAGVKVRWHSLRHFCATQLLEMGLDHFAVSIQLRHTDGGALVMRRYGHPSVDAAKRRLLTAFELPEDAGGRTAVRRGAHRG